MERVLRRRKSITKGLNLTLVVVMILLFIEFVATYFSNQQITRGLSEMHQIIQTVVQVRNLRQVLATKIDLVKDAIADRKTSDDERFAISQTERQIEQLFKTCLELSSFKPQVQKLISDAKIILEPGAPAIQSILNNTGVANEQILLLDQFVLEAQDSLGKVQIVLSDESDAIFKQVYGTRYMPLMVNFILSVGFIAIVIWMGRRLTQRITVPIKDLIHHSVALSGGNLNARAKIYDDDELGLLAHSFNKMAESLEQSTVSKSYVENILESMFNCVLVIDKSGVIKTVNRLTVETFGYAKHELIGLSIFQILHDEDVKSLTPNSNLETEAYTAAGKEISVLVSIADLDNGQGVGSDLRVCVIKDISESIKLQNEIKERNIALNAANQELEAFSYSVSHDLRAPLRIIDGFSQALLEDAGDQLNPDAKSHIERIRAGVQRMGQLIDAVLNLSRLTRTNMTLADVDLSAMAKNIIQDLKSLEPQRRVEAMIHDGINGYADPVLIKITLENLLGNAWKYSSKQELSKIEFGQIKKDTQTVYFVKDNGIGFDMTYAKKLFTPFQRLHTQSEFAGTGIGLASAKRIIHRHGGRIWVESAPEKGTTVFFTLS